MKSIFQWRVEPCGAGARASARFNVREVLAQMVFRANGVRTLKRRERRAPFAQDLFHLLAGRSIQYALATSLIAIFPPLFSSGHAQGSLTPPGVPAPTMKSLDQIEPRTIVNAVNTPGDAYDLFTISQPGSYYLTTNYTIAVGSGISILTNNVVLDLAGFTVQGGSNSADGIVISGVCTNVVVRNGSVIGWSVGVASSRSYSANQVFEQMSVSGCGAGISISSLTGGTVVRNCNCFNCSIQGIDCVSGAICGCTVNNNLYGIMAVTVTVSDCFVRSNSESGIFIYGNGCNIIRNNCSGNNSGGFGQSGGIAISGSNNRIEDNVVSGSGYCGIGTFGGSGNIIIKNTVSGNGTTDYFLESGNNQVPGPLISSFGTITNSNPWANFAF